MRCPRPVFLRSCDSNGNLRILPGKRLLYLSLKSSQVISFRNMKQVPRLGRKFDVTVRCLVKEPFFNCHADYNNLCFPPMRIKLKQRI